MFKPKPSIQLYGLAVAGEQILFKHLSHKLCVKTLNLILLLINISIIIICLLIFIFICIWYCIYNRDIVKNKYNTICNNVYKRLTNFYMIYYDIYNLITFIINNIVNFLFGYTMGIIVLKKNSPY